ncbi:MAG: hypothetical protein JXM79_19790, partial [Sedimentisphaerales bacterium]|nr:hypothetical protein [Sedimentisphaerales bacterium]
MTRCLAKYRFPTGSREFDAFLTKQMSLYMRFKLRGDRSALVTAVRQNAEALGKNKEMYKSPYMGKRKCIP